jgi:hydrogenase-4 membrane subunit HyfE
MPVYHFVYNITKNLNTGMNIVDAIGSRSDITRSRDCLQCLQHLVVIKLSNTIVKILGYCLNTNCIILFTVL